MRLPATVRALSLAAATAACGGDEASRIAGCYRFDAPFFDWFDYDTTSKRGHTEASAIIELLAAPDARLIERPGRPDPALGVRVPGMRDTATMAARLHAALSFWGFVARDSIWLLWSDGSHGWTLWLRPHVLGLDGSADEISDMGGFPTRHLEHLHASRIQCPP
jgi:hypothetical protein